jgi:hypothetical protein
MASLVKVRSFLGVAEAELARIRLAMDGIPARLSNAEMVIWFWHYSNATGGVKLFVNSSDTQRAALILDSKSTPQQWQLPQWICPKCQADVDGSWSSCWSCGTSKKGEEDPDFHTWYSEPLNGSLVGKTYTDVIAAIISVSYLVLFLSFKTPLSIISAWLITIMLWVLISRFLSLHKIPMFNAADLGSESENPSPTHYDPSLDDFNPADDMAYKLWKAALFSFAYAFMFFPFALWLWYKTNQHALSLSAKGLSHYFYSLIFIIANIFWHGWILFVASYHFSFYIVWQDLFR